MNNLVVLAILLLTATSAVAQGPTPSPPRTKLGAITGRVVNENGQPLQNVIVYVRPFGIRTGQTAVSDGEGKF